MNVHIIPFIFENYDEVLSLWQRCEGIGLSEADSRQNIRKYLERNPGMSFIAKGQGRIVGAALCGHDGRRGCLHHLAVLPEYRRCGIGKKLADRCLRALQEAGIQKCHLFVFKNNDDGLQFWKKIGWTPRMELSIVSASIDTACHSKLTRIPER